MYKISDKVAKSTEVILDKELGQTPEALSFQIDKGINFLNLREKSYIKKVINSHIDFRDELLNIDDYNLRQIRQKFFKTKFTNESSGKVLGISFALKFFDVNEKFNYKHITSIVSRLVPGIRVVDDSYYFCQYSQEDILFCYFEIEKIRGKHLSLQETLYIKKILPKEINDTIETPCASLFMPSNEEEIYKNIATLSKEVSNISSLPHVMISFVKQDYESLYFNIVLVRLLPIGKPAFQNLASQIPLKLRLYINRTTFTPDNIVKEICVFSAEVPALQFRRKNFSIHFLRLRKYLSLILERYIGEFRDFNGGLYIKQCEQLDQITKSIAEKVDNFTLIEEFFLSFVPSEIQPLILPKTALSLYELFEKAKRKVYLNYYHLEYSQSKSALIIFVKTKNEKVESLLYNIAFDKKILTAYTKLVIDKQTYFCFLQINPSDLSLLLEVEQSLKDFEKSEKNAIPDTLRIPFQESLPPSLHPHLATDTNCATVCKALFENLTRINLKGKVENAIAKKITVSTCQKRYTITLKETSWSNGEPLFAEHFVNAWKKAISPNSRCLRVSFFFVIKNAKQFLDGEVSFDDVGIYSPTKDCIIIDLEHPVPYFNQLLADPLYAPLYDLSNQEPEIFNGPFKFLSHKKNKCLVLTKNLFYWDVKKTKINQIEILLVKKFSNMVDMFYKNQLDWVGSPFSNLLDDERKYNHCFQEKKTSVPFWLHCNTNNKKLSSFKIRNALSLAIERTKINDEVLPGQVVSYQIIPSSLSFLKTINQNDEKNLHVAKRLFEEGLEEINLKAEEYYLTISYSEKTNFQANLARFLKKSWEKAFGIQVILNEEEWNDHWNNLFNGMYEICGMCKFPTYLDIAYFFEAFLQASSNFSKWENQNFFQNVELAKKATSKEERHIYLKNAEEVLQKELPVIPFYNRTHLYLSNPNLKNLTPSDLAYVDLKYCYFKK